MWQRKDSGQVGSGGRKEVVRGRFRQKAGALDRSKLAVCMCDVVLEDRVTKVKSRELISMTEDPKAQGMVLQGLFVCSLSLAHCSGGEARH